jgi:hypothetical protein
MGNKRREPELDFKSRHEIEDVSDWWKWYGDKSIWWKYLESSD